MVGLNSSSQSCRAGSEVNGSRGDGTESIDSIHCVSATEEPDASRVDARTPSELS